MEEDKERLEAVIEVLADYACMMELKWNGRHTSRKEVIAKAEAQAKGGDDK
jgi:hypothetical protein